MIAAYVPVEEHVVLKPPTAHNPCSQRAWSSQSAACRHSIISQGQSVKQTLSSATPQLPDGPCSCLSIVLPVELQLLPTAWAAVQMFCELHTRLSEHSSAAMHKQLVSDCRQGTHVQLPQLVSGEALCLCSQHLQG